MSLEVLKGEFGFRAKYVAELSSSGLEDLLANAALKVGVPKRSIGGAMVPGERCDYAAGVVEGGLERGRMPRGGGSRGRRGTRRPLQRHRPFFQDHSSGSEDVRAAAAMGGARDGPDS
jgi:hypothetical protein